MKPLACLALLASLLVPPATAQREEIALDGLWQFQREGETTWRTVSVPASFEEHEGTEFDGVGIYRRALSAIELHENQRVLLHFDAVATKCEVWLGETRIGSHVGGWTPFRFDLTDAWRAHAGEAPPMLRVRAEEMVGHDTQGFLPIIAPHFGGIWQSVKLIVVAQTWIDDLRLLAVGETDSQRLRLEVPLAGPVLERARLRVRHRLRGEEAWSSPHVVPVPGAELSTFVALKQPRSWTPREPNLYELEIQIENESGVLDRIRTRAAFRAISVRGRTLRLGGQDLTVRGLLNWGYAPPGVAPSVDETHMLAELRVARELGFNLIKFCLWIPPKRYLELCDELGIFAWVEYPTWHAEWTPDRLAPYREMYAEFFHFDRNHPSVILRSLTCETGPSADLGVITSLYDLGHAMIPGAVIEDDSSWIGWNRVSDIWDDHPYGNNHTWVATLERLERHIEQHGDKPLILGEAIAADTWTNPGELASAIGEERPFWLPRFFEGNQRWLERMRPIVGDGPLQRLEEDSKRYALWMRKYQIETYRREVPHGGYVVSVMRDVPLCAMGFVDYLGRPKWSPDEWSWHGETMLLLRTENDRRSFFSGELLHAEVIPTDDSQGDLRVEPARQEPLPIVERPTRITVRAEFAEHPNEWPLWILPTIPETENADVLVTRHLDSELLDQLESGARVLLLPSGEKGSPPLSQEWFLRGAPLVAEHPLLEVVPREMLIELQHFDLAGPVIPDVDYLEEIDPVLLLWHNHDLDHVRTHGLVYETRVGEGRLLVSALNHEGETNAAGRWLRHLFLEHLRDGPPPQRALRPATIARMREKIAEQVLDLTQRTWRFKPDPDNVGLGERWHVPDLALDDSWTSISVGRSWEGQGHARLDGWAWYRLDVNVPSTWKNLPIYLSLEGADDYYEVYIDGKLAGTGGDMETRTTAFDERKSHPIAPLLTPGQTAHLAIRIHDWHGAGGLHRPVRLTTAPLAQGPELLR